MLGASGGVGLAAVELGKLMGARVIACASTDDKLAFARAHGAHEGVNYENETCATRSSALGGEHGIDVVFDPVGGPYSEPAVRSLAWEGRHLVVGFAAGEIPEAAAQSRAAQGLRGARRVLGRMGAARHARATRPRSSQLARWCAEGKLSCHIQQVYPLAETPQALKALADRKVMGKLVVRVEL